MNISFKILKGFKVYHHTAHQPWGTVESVSLNPMNGKINSLIVNTISLIPLSHIIKIEQISHIKDHCVFLNSNYSASFIKASCTDKDFINHSVISNVNCGKLRDFKFSMETGEITDVIVSKHKISKKTEIPINNIYIKDNTIYIDEKGGY